MALRSCRQRDGITGAARRLASAPRHRLPRRRLTGPPMLGGLRSGQAARPTLGTFPVPSAPRSCSVPGTSPASGAPARVKGAVSSPLAGLRAAPPPLTRAGARHAPPRPLRCPASQGSAPRRAALDVSEASHGRRSDLPPGGGPAPSMAARRPCLVAERPPGGEVLPPHRRRSPARYGGGSSFRSGPHGHRGQRHEVPLARVGKPVSGSATHGGRRGALDEVPHRRSRCIFESLSKRAARRYRHREAAVGPEPPPERA